ncbi:MAG: hypothetical protein PWQ10_536 [Patescibacteria group bacterium]|nr:hypothetical protein [Patescibacteria group bacterium]
MFTHLLLKDDIPFGVDYSAYAKRHYLKQLQKDNPGKQWSITEDGIFEDLSRITYTDQDLQQTQQVDELWHKNEYWIFKYDFRIAGTIESTKGSGNRCVVFINTTRKSMEILMIFHHKYLPKNTKESHYIKQILTKNFNNYLEKCR